MNVRFLVVVIFNIFLAHCTFAQGGTWIWMAGTDSVNTAPVYGTLGIAATANTPGGLYEATRWNDTAGNFWLFGGIGMRTDNLYNDLWKYDPSTNLWAWVKGPGIPNQAGVYGRQGLPDINNNPGARGWGAHSWTDNNGDLWLFGGSGYDSAGNSGILNDLWRYHIASNEWTWMKGCDTMNAPNVYGTLRQAADTTTPGARSEGTDDWVDADNNLWFWGGEGGTNPGGPPLMYADMWKYSVADNKWAWVSGPQGTGHSGGNNGLGIESQGALPNSRSTYTNWQDKQGHFFIFGGFDFDDYGTVYYAHNQYSDVWRYNTADNCWCWIAGSLSPDYLAAYNQYCTDDNLYDPGARFENRTPQLRGCNTALLTFGGFNDEYSNCYNDLWLFKPQTLQWRWISGSPYLNGNGWFGTKQVPSAFNLPHARGGHCAWYDNSGNLWIFGGMDSLGNKYNDMWEFIPDSACLSLLSSDTIEVTAAKTRLCAGDSVQLCAPAGYNAYSWSTGATSSCIYVNTAGNYTVSASSANNCTSFSRPVQITVDTIPVFEVNATGDTLSVSIANASAWQWYQNGNRLTGATSAMYIAPASGSYTAEITDTSGCKANSAAWVVSATQQLNENSVVIYPNPSHNYWAVKTDSRLTGSTLMVFSTDGKLLYTIPLTGNQTIISLPDLPGGLYELHITGLKFAFIGKLVKI